MCRGVSFFIFDLFHILFHQVVKFINEAFAVLYLRAIGFKWIKIVNGSSRSRIKTVGSLPGSCPGGASWPGEPPTSLLRPLLFYLPPMREGLRAI